MGLALPRPCCPPAVDPGTRSREVTVFRGVVEAQLPRVIREPLIPTPSLLHLWRLFVFNFSFSVNKKPLGKQPVRPCQLWTEIRPRLRERRVVAAPELRGLLIGSPAQGVRSLSSADLNTGPEAGGRGSGLMLSVTGPDLWKSSPKKMGSAVTRKRFVSVPIPSAGAEGGPRGV